MKTVIIIGGGLGGLFTGAMLAKEGMKVTVVEKNATIGGGLQSFKRFGVSFDTGMHIIGGMRPNGNIYRICNYLGVLDKINIRDVDDDCTDTLYFEEDRKSYKIAKGKKGFVDSLAKYFPSEREALERYVDDIFSITNEMNLFYLRPSSSFIQMHSPSFGMYADEYIAGFFKDEKLRTIVAYTNPLYGGRAHQTPAFIHAIISVLYINGASRVVDDSSHFADALAEVIKSNGGSIIKGEKVVRVAVTNRHIDKIITDTSRELQADDYISSIHPCALFNIVDEGTFPKSYINRLESIPNAYSAFSLYIKMKPQSFKYFNYSEYYMTKYNEIWNFGRTDKPWPLGFMMMTPPESQQNEYANKVLVTAPMTFDMVRRWENTTVGKRGKEYTEWKEQTTQLLLDKVEIIHPGFRDCIEAINSSSPLTIRDFYGSKEGCISGFSKDAGNLILSQVPVVTKVDNLFLTGQNINMHGFCGVPLSAITTCEAILGKNYLIDKIGKCAD